MLHNTSLRIKKMDGQIEMIDLTFRDLDSHDVRVLSNAARLYRCLWEMRDYLRDKITLAEELAIFDGRLKAHHIIDLFDDI